MSAPTESSAGSTETPTVRQLSLDPGGADAARLTAFAQDVLGDAARGPEEASAEILSLTCDFLDTPAGATGAATRWEGRAWVARRTRSIVFVTGEIHAIGVDGARPVLGATGLWRLTQS